MKNDKGGGGGGNFLPRKREGFLERGVHRGFTVRKTHRSIDFIILEAFLKKKKCLFPATVLRNRLKF